MDNNKTIINQQTAAALHWTVFWSSLSACSAPLFYENYFQQPTRSIAEPHTEISLIFHADSGSWKTWFLTQTLL